MVTVDMRVVEQAPGGYSCGSDSVEPASVSVEPTSNEVRLAVEENSGENVEISDEISSPMNVEGESPIISRESHSTSDEDIVLSPFTEPSSSSQNVLVVPSFNQTIAPSLEGSPIVSGSEYDPSPTPSDSGDEDEIPEVSMRHTRAASGIVKSLKYNPKFNLSMEASKIPVPRSIKFAIEVPQWKQAMQEEFNALMKNQTWKLIPR